MRIFPVLAALAGVACSPAGASPQAPAAGLQMSDCRLPAAGRLAQCATLEVPLNRAEPAGKKIGLRVVRLSARGDNPAVDPLFMLAGGPGQASSEAFPAMLAAFSGVARDRDIVLVDQRGTGQSAPLDCELPDDLASQLRDEGFVEAARLCRAQLGPDTMHFTTAAAVDDVEAVRRALGYGAINLIGGSYGTRLALAYAKRHPEATRSVVLDGVAPMAMAIPLSMAKDGQRAFDLMAKRCGAAPACQAAFPDLQKDLQTILTELENEPKRVIVSHPRTAEKVEVTISRDAFSLALRGLLYAPELVAILPLAIASAKAGDYAPLIAQVSLLGEASQKSMSLGLFISVVCSEDVPRITAEATAAETANTFIGSAMVDEFKAACASWPRATLPEGYADPVRATMPVLVLSGELDPVTPPRWGEEAVKHLPQSRHLVIPGMGHGVSSRGCMPRIIRDFLAEPGQLAKLDAECIDRVQTEVPPFFVDFAGPAH